jgi:Mrp family chromosome partitioning ATPase
MEAEMLELYRTVETLLPQLRSRVLQFIGSREGEGTSTIVREFARVSATRIGKSVLVLDADRHRNSRHHLLGEHSDFGWIEAIETGKNVEEAIYQMGKSSLYFSPSRNSSTSTPQIFDSPRIEDLWASLRARFDLVLIDSAPLSMSPDGLAIASRVDGVVIVLEAEKTHWRAVKNVEESIRKVEGNILGLVFNKRRFYLPEFIYKLL